MRWSFILFSLLCISISTVLSAPIPGRGNGGRGRSSRASSPSPSHSRSTSPAPAVHHSPPPPAHKSPTHNSRSSSPVSPAHIPLPPSRSPSPAPSHDDKKSPPPSRPASPGPGPSSRKKGKKKELPPRREQPSRKGKAEGSARAGEFAKAEADPKPKKWTPKYSSKKYREAAKDAPWSVSPSTKNPKEWTIKGQKGAKRDPKAGEHADHVFEAQMLKKGLQKGGIDWHSLSKEHQNGLKGILNGKENMQFIPGNVNMAKGRVVTSSLRPASSRYKQPADPNSKNSIKKQKKKDEAQKKNTSKKTKAPKADPESVTNYMKTSAPIAGSTAQQIDEYLTKNQLHSKPLMMPLLEDTYRKQGIIGKGESIGALPKQ